MQRHGYTKVSLALSLAAAIGLGYIAYLQYRLAEVDSIIAKTIVGAQKAAKEAGKQVKDGKKNQELELINVAELEGKGWVLSKDKTVYEYKGEDGRVHAALQLDKETGKVLYKIDCGSFADEFAQQECSEALDGTGKNYVNTDNVPW